MELEITWKRTFVIWWAIAWRAILFSVLAGFVVGLVVGIGGSILHIDKQTVQSLSSLFGGVVGLIVGVYVLKLILQKKFNEFRIVLIKNNNE